MPTRMLTAGAVVAATVGLLVFGVVAQWIAPSTALAHGAQPTRTTQGRAAHVVPTPAAGGFSARPDEYSTSDPATRAYFKLRVRPGASYAGKVVVGNNGASPVTLRVYPADGLTGVTSGTVYSDAGDTLRGAGTWVSLTRLSVTISPHTSIRVPFRVLVPRSASSGTHLAGIAVENAEPPRTGGRFSVREVFRVVVGVEIRVPGPTRAALALTRAALAPLPGTSLASVQVGVANRGQRLCWPRLTVDLGGNHMNRTVTRRLDVILPGNG